jgi:hypothetical protein
MSFSTAKMLSRGNLFTADGATEYTAAGDFCGIFSKNMDCLYQLALVLMVHEKKAEQCLLASLEDCIDGKAVFRDWALCWSKRAVVKNAIRLISPTPCGADGVRMLDNKEGTDLYPGIEPAAFMYLRAFDRFVFVMTVLEGYSHRDCSLLLNCTIADVIGAGMRALRQMARSEARLSFSGEAFRPAAKRTDAEVA